MGQRTTNRKSPQEKNEKSGHPAKSAGAYQSRKVYDHEGQCFNTTPSQARQKRSPKASVSSDKIGAETSAAIVAGLAKAAENNSPANAKPCQYVAAKTLEHCLHPETFSYQEGKAFENHGNWIFKLVERVYFGKGIYVKVVLGERGGAGGGGEGGRGRRNTGRLDSIKKKVQSQSSAAV